MQLKQYELNLFGKNSDVQLKSYTIVKSADADADDEQEGAAQQSTESKVKEFKDSIELLNQQHQDKQ